MHRIKAELILSIDKDNMKALPQRYINAIKSLKANRNVIVCHSDKGKETVVCHRDTYLSLIHNHFSDTRLYNPVEATDISGNDLKHMT